MVVAMICLHRECCGGRNSRASSPDSRVVEPNLQRERKHKGAADGGGSYSAELIGYVEIGPQ